MSALDDLDELIASGVVRFASVGISTLSESRHATISICGPKSAFAQGYGDTSEGALAAAIASIGKTRGPVKTKPVKSAVEDDDLADILG